MHGLGGLHVPHADVLPPIGQLRHHREARAIGCQGDGIEIEVAAGPEIQDHMAVARVETEQQAVLAPGDDGAIGLPQQRANSQRGSGPGANERTVPRIDEAQPFLVVKGDELLSISAESSPHMASIFRRVGPCWLALGCVPDPDVLVVALGLEQQFPIRAE